MNIRRKIWFAIALSTLFVSISVVLIIYFDGRKMAVTEAEHILLENTQRLGKDFESAFSALQHSTKMLEGILKANFRPADLDNNEIGLNEFKTELEPVFDSILQSLHPFSLWWILNPELSGGKHGLSYWDADGKGMYTREEEYNINDYDLSSPEMAWWVKAIEYGEYWTNPYFWENWNRELISFSKAIYSDGILIGVAGSDFHFDDLRKRTADITVFETGYIFLLDSSLNFILHPYEEGKNLKDILPIKNFVTIKNQLENSENGISRYTYRNEKKIAGYSRLSNGWIIGAAPPEREVYQQVKEMSILLILLLIVTMILAWGIAWYLGQKLTDPLYLLMDHFRKGAQGNLADRINYKSKDELGELAQHYNFFMQKIEHLVNNLKDTEEKLIEARIKAEESNELKTAILSNISHEIRTPLNSISGFSSLMAQKELGEKKMNEYAEIVNKNVHQLAEIVTGLLEVSKLQAEEFVLNYQEFELIRVLNQLINKHKEKLNKKNVNIRLSAEFEVIKIYSDPYRLKQVIDTLLSNAVKFTDEGYIEVGCIKNENGIEICVTDTGSGISKEIQSSVFDAFKRGNDNPQIYGIGTGLAICRQIIHKMKGEIRFEPNLPHGSIFIAQFPIGK